MRRRPVLLTIGVLLVALFAWVPAPRAKMPDISQMSGIPRPDTTVPDGTVVVRVVRGSFANNAVNQPVTLSSATKTMTVRTDDQGHATFGNFPPGTVVQASTDLDGQHLTSQQFPVPGQGGAILLLVGNAPGGAAAAPAQKAIPGNVVFAGQSRVVIDPGDGDIQLFYLLDVVNNAGKPVSPPSTFEIDMPAAGQGTALLQGSTVKAVVNGNHIVVPGPFPAGESLLEVGTVVPYYSGSLTINQKFPADLVQLAVVARRIGNLDVVSPQITNKREVPDKGEVYVAGTGPEVKAGQTLTLTLTGLPYHSQVPMYSALGLAILIGILGVFFIATAGRPTGNEARVKKLRGQRERLFADLVQLEEQHAAGALTPDQYAVRRSDVMSRLERIYGQIEDETATGGDQGLAA